MTEPWLIPDERQGPDARRADLLKGLQQVRVWIEAALDQLPEEAALWWEPAPGIPSIGARVQHILRASRRLAAYALDPAPDPEALAAEARLDWLPRAIALAPLRQELRQQFEELARRIEALSDAALDEIRYVGRRRLPVRRATILHHLIEHAAHHSGQLILLARLYRHRSSAG
ncbi:DinB family protein [Rhodothermus profundi]|uniref:Uncharacterized damage-inducible protein DinB (Forms a four-helix bundle) n=1 Tax=Rhodothermus profundi TaxID=633813 RepID=A0A1M6XPF2_9BACT|nr:DinB family protein [Rhodothermus profundi]SHL07773.1 Uncharacterized damage-inducible protein DinB (forms a four-helix bundle) [Rhodothermus profundi]